MKIGLENIIKPEPIVVAEPKKDFTIAEGITVIPELATFDPEEVLAGLKDEREHSDDIQVVAAIVYAHLKEFAHYYAVVLPALDIAKKLCAKISK